jgi:RND family efflux transporter MFP subunit
MDVRADQHTDGLRKPAVKGRFGVRAMMIGAPILLVVAAFAGPAIMKATAKKPDKKTEEVAPIAVEIASATAVDAAPHVVAQGQVKSKTEAEIAAQVSGQIVYVSPNFEAGAPVRKGELLARIDAQSYRLAAERARSQVARARESYDRIRVEARLAEEDWNSIGLGSNPSDLTLFKPQVAAAGADLRTAEAAVGEAQLNLARTEIRAPFDGRIGSRRIDVGDFATPGAPIATMFSTEVAQVRIPLTDENLHVLGAPPGFAAPAGAGPSAKLSATVAGVERQWTGRLAAVEASVDPQTRVTYGLIEVRDPFSKNHPAPLAPGLFVRVDLVGSQTERLVALPPAALKRSEFVYVVDAKNAIRIRTPEIAMIDGDRVFVRSGVADGERVVLSYIPSPRDGMKVRDIKDPEPPKAEKQAAAKDKKKSKDRDKKADDKDGR